MKWIPINERLPNDGEIVLITVWEDWSYGKGTKIETHVDIASFDISDGYFKVENGFFNTFTDWLEGQPCKITAWMPLPEPYSKIITAI